MPNPLLMRLLDSPSRWQALDPFAARIKAVVDRLVPAGPMADLLHGRAVGHPAHPPLAQAALSGWTGAALLAAWELSTSSSGSKVDPSVEARRHGLGAIGIVAAAPTVASGWADWSDLHEDQQRTGLVHSSIMGSALTLSVTARLVRRRRTSALLDLAAGVLATVGGALGGHLAYRWSAGPNHAEAFPHLAREGWSRVAKIDDLVEGQLIAGVAGDEPVVVGRQGGEVIALADRCSHLGGPLHEGSVQSVGGQTCLVCPWHQSAFAIDDGSVRRGPATAPQPVLEARVAYGWVDVRPVPLPGVAGR